MSDLLETALRAHGGLSTWQALHDVAADVSLSGSLWERKRRTLGTHFSVSAATQDQQVIISPYPRSGRLGLFDCGFVCVEGAEDEIVESREYARLRLTSAQVRESWDDLDALYFLSYTLWHQLVTPFLFSYPGIVSQELEDWNEDGEVWRRARIAFPNEFVSHSREHTVCFGGDGLIRRQDYMVDVLGGLHCIEYASSYERLNGIVVPMRHVIEGRHRNGADECLSLTVQFSSARFS